MSKLHVIFLVVLLIMGFLLANLALDNWKLNNNKFQQEQFSKDQNLLQQGRVEGALIVIQHVVKNGFFDFQLDVNTKITLIESNYAQNTLFPKWLQMLQNQSLK